MYYEAIFCPSQVKKNNHDVNRMAGKRVALLGGLIHEAGPYQGQRCFFIPKAIVGWIPEGDLLYLRPVPFSRWEKTHQGLGLSC